jgi:hypothetical protein
MLIISLILSALLLLIANLLARRSQHAGMPIVCSCAAFAIGPLFLACFLPTVAMQGLLLGVGTMVWRATRRGPADFLKLSIGATLVAYGLSGIMVFQSERTYASLRARYPYESMEVRLPSPRALPVRTDLLPVADQRLSRLEGEISDHADGFREHQLRTLHEHSVLLFIESPGFGVTRMLHPSEYGLTVNLRREPVPLQPGSRSTAMWSPSEMGRLPVEDETSLGRMVEDSILDFANPRGFGYFKDRRHVAGFETHRFSQVPTPADRWKVRALELVSLLLHDGPEVYVSSHLPRMDQLGDLPTRPPDRFENFALEALRQGEDTVTTRDGQGLRMLGAIRNARQCIACHGGERGELLGAFSYTLQADGS